MTKDEKYLLFSDDFKKDFFSTFTLVDYRRKWILYDIHDIVKPVIIGHRLYTVGKEGFVEIDLETNKENVINIPGLNFSDRVEEIRLSHDEKTIFFQYNDSVKCVDLLSKKIINSMLCPDYNSGNFSLIDISKNDSTLLLISQGSYFIWDYKSSKKPDSIANFDSDQHIIRNLGDYIVLMSDKKCLIIDNNNFKIVKGMNISSNRGTPIFYNHADYELTFLENLIDANRNDKERNIIKTFKLKDSSQAEPSIKVSDNLMWCQTQKLNDGNILFYSNSFAYLWYVKKKTFKKIFTSNCINGSLLTHFYNELSDEIIFGSQCEGLEIFNLKSEETIHLFNGPKDQNPKKMIRENSTGQYLTAANSFYNFCLNESVMALMGENYLLETGPDESYLLQTNNDSLAVYSFPNFRLKSKYYIGKYFSNNRNFQFHLLDDKYPILRENRGVLILNENPIGYVIPEKWDLVVSRGSKNLFYVVAPTLDSIHLAALENDKVKEVYNYYTDYKKMNYFPSRDSIYNQNNFGYSRAGLESYKFELNNNRIFVSPNGNYILSILKLDSTRYTFINATSKTQHTFYVPTPKIIRSESIDDDGNILIENKLLIDTTNLPQSIKTLSFIPWNNNLAIATSDSETFIIDIPKEKCIRRYPFSYHKEHFCRFISSDKTIELFINGNNKKLIKLDSFLNISQTVDLEESYGNHPEFRQAPLVAISQVGTRDNVLKNYLFNTKTGRRFTVYQINNEYLILNDKNYYMSSNTLPNQIIFDLNNNYFAFEQFDLKFNRPDIITKELGCDVNAKSEIFYKAYQKRLKKMGFTEDMLKDDFNLPQIKIKNLKGIPAVVDSSRINIELELQDSLYKLDRINIYINNVPICGASGIDLRIENALSLKKKVSIELTEGQNKVQVSVLNQVGAESYKETVYITYRPKQIKKPDLYLITIGDSKYNDARYNLTYASKDAKDISKIFKQNAIYKKVYSYLISNEDVIKENIVKLKNELLKANRNDVVIITVAGHGVLDKDLNYYLAMHDMDFNVPSEKGLLYDELESLVDGIRPLKKLILIDACHSGEIDKEEVEQLAKVNTFSEDVKFRAVGVGLKKKNIGLKSTGEWMSELFTDLRKGTGATVISSAGGAEYAMESDRWKNGLFTYCLLHGLKDKAADLNNDGQVMLSELQNYLRTEVTKLSNGAQQPNSRIENLTMDFRIW